MKTLLQGGSIVTASGVTRADLLIDGEKIAAIGTGLCADGAPTVDVSGRLLFPGFIDGHTHMNLAVAGTVTADDFATGTQAAIAGGTTTIVDFGTQYKGETLQQGLDNWHAMADGKCSCDYGFHMSIADWNAGVRSELPAMFAQGVSTFKLYLTYDNMMVGDRAVYEILRELAPMGGICGVHCEHNEVIKELQEEELRKPAPGPHSHAASRPAALEAEAISRLLRLAQVAHAPVWIVHLSTKEGLEEIRRARRRGQTVIAETCPQYLLMDEGMLSRPDGDKFICAPPLRTKEDQDALWDALKAGEIQIISTDHCSFTTEQKKLGADDFRKIPGGLPGVETRGVLLYTFGVSEGRLTPADLCRLLSENPAKLFGLYPKKGVLTPGSDADIVVLDPNRPSVISAAAHHSASDYEPLEGTPLTCSIDRVYLRGTPAAQDGALTAGCIGRYLPRRLPAFGEIR